MPANGPSLTLPVPCDDLRFTKVFILFHLGFRCCRHHLRRSLAARLRRACVADNPSLSVSFGTSLDPPRQTTMGDSKSRYEHLPIPTYEEATSSRPTSSQSRLGPEEISDDAERQGLLRGDNGNYQPPTVESARPSLDSLDGLEHDEEEEVRREMQQMDIEDPGSDSSSNRSLLRYRLSKRFSTFTNSFSSLTLPSFRSYFSNF